MINKKNILIVIILLLFCFVTSCSNNSDEPVGIKVTYELNGGIFQNCTLPIKQYYQYEENQDIIFDILFLYISNGHFTLQT